MDCKHFFTQHTSKEPAREERRLLQRSSNDYFIVASLVITLSATCLFALNRRTGLLIKRYADAGGTVSEADANAIMDEYISIEKARLAQLETFRPRFAKVLPVTKAARYFQIENKIRAVIQYELAEGIPLM